MWLKILKWPLFVLFFLFVFVVAVHLTFPSAALKTFVKAKLEDKLFAQNQNWKTPPSVQVGDASLWRLTGADLRQVQIQEGSRDEGGESQGAKWVIDKLQLRVGIFAYIFGTYRLSANLEAYGAYASGAFGINKTTSQVENLWIEAEDLNLAKMAGLASKVGPLEGVATLSFNFETGANLAQDASGSLKLDIDNLGTKKGQFSLPGISISMPDSRLGKFEGEFDISKGIAKSKTLKITGGELSAEANLSAKLVKDIMRSSLDGNGWIKPSETFLKKAPLIASFLPKNPPEGKHYFAVAGMLSNPTTSMATKDSINQKGNINPLRNMGPKR